MNQGQVLDTNGEGEGTFNFAKWVIDSHLTEIKHLFTKHRVTKRSSLTITSEEFQSLLKDAELQQKPYLFPIVMDALTKIPPRVPDAHDVYTKIVVYAEEQSVIDNMTNTITILENTFNQLKKLKSKHINSVNSMKETKLRQISETRNKINKLFLDITNTIEIKKQILLKTLENIEKDINIHQKSEGMDDYKEHDILSIAMQKLENEKECLYHKINKCKTMIEAANKHENIQQRKAKIIKIGKDTTKNFDKMQNELAENIKMIKNAINKNENDVSSIDYFVNNNKYNNILNGISNLGTIVNQKKQKQSVKNMIMKIDKNDKTNELMADLVRKSSQITKQKEIINDLNITLGETIGKYLQCQTKLISCLSFDESSQNRWYVNNDNDNERKCDINDILIGKINNDSDCINIIFTDKNIKKRVLRNNLSLTPQNNDMESLCDLVSIFKANITENILKNMEAPKVKFVDVVGISWDKKCKSAKFSVSWLNQNELTFNGLDYNEYGIAFLSHYVNDGEHHWTFKLNKYKEGTSLMIGICDKNIAIKMNLNINSFLGNLANSCYVLMATQAKLNVYNKDDKWTYPDSYGVRCNQGSIITMMLNYFNLTLSFEIDGKSYGKAFDVKHTGYIPAISTNFYGNSIEILRYQKME